MGADESRQYPRYALEVAVEIKTGDRVLAGRSRNLSQGGFSGLVDDKLLPGTDVFVSLALVFDTDTFSEPLELPARVVWSTAIGDGHQLGVSFRQLSDDQQQFLDMFLRYLEEGLARARTTNEADRDIDDPFTP